MPYRGGYDDDYSEHSMESYAAPRPGAFRSVRGGAESVPASERAAGEARDVYYDREKGPGFSYQGFKIMEQRRKLIAGFGSHFAVDLFLVFLVVEFVLLIPLITVTAEFYHTALHTVYNETGKEWIGGKALAAIVLLVLDFLWIGFTVTLLMNEVLLSDRWRKKVLLGMIVVDLIAAALFGYVCIYYGPGFQFLQCSQLAETTFNTNYFGQGNYSFPCWAMSNGKRCHLGKAVVGLAGAEMGLLFVSVCILGLLYFKAGRGEMK